MDRDDRAACPLAGERQRDGAPDDGGSIDPRDGPPGNQMDGIAEAFPSPDSR